MSESPSAVPFPSHVRPFRDFATRRRWAILALVAFGVFVSLLWIVAAPKGNIHTGDTDNLVKGARVAVDCIRSGVWNACGRVTHARTTSVFPYPLLQYLPAALLVRRGWNDGRIVGALARLNILVFAVYVGLLVVAARRFRRTVWIGVLVVVGLASTLPYQATAGFGEMLTATAVLAAVVAALYRRPVLMFLTIVIASMGKETMFVFVAGLAVLCARGEDDDWLPPARQTLAAVGGLVVGYLVGAAFNVFRFGTTSNVMYLDPILRTPGTGRRLVFLLGVWFSPTAGVVVFWPMAFLAFLTTTVIVLRTVASRSRRNLRGWLPGVLAIVLVVGYTFGLALWFSPFGWITYGPRLAVPILGAGAVTALWTVRSRLEPVLVKVFKSPIQLSLLGLAVVALGWPQFASAWTHAASVNDLIAADATCPAMTQVTIQADRTLYFRCTTHTMWRTTRLPVRDAIGGGGRGALLARVLGSVVCVGALLDGRRLLSEPADQASPRDELTAEAD